MRAVCPAYPFIESTLKIMRISTLFVALLFAVVTFAIWALINRPTEVVPWPEEISGFAFSPFQRGQDAIFNVMPTED